MSLQIVQKAKSDLESAGESLSGPCGAWKIANLVAWRMRAAGYGLLRKPGGNNCDGYSVDYVVRKSDGQGFDMLGDAGGANIPTWQFGDAFGPERWAPPISPETGISVADPPDTAPLEAQVTALKLQLTEVLKQLSALNTGFKQLSEDAVRKPLPDYVGSFRVLGYTVNITSHPRQ